MKLSVFTCKHTIKRNIIFYENANPEVPDDDSHSESPLTLELTAPNLKSTALYFKPIALVPMFIALVPMFIALV
ncbi:MAG TPA: hypothetical protein PLM41_15415, partial [Saprospiraceae bacterium]|nr:hypothetical protein [Saprospiraceae bacterium]